MRLFIVVCMGITLVGCAQATWEKTGSAVGTPQAMTQAAADGYVKKTAGESLPNPYSR